MMIYADRVLSDAQGFRAEAAAGSAVGAGVAADALLRP